MVLISIHPFALRPLILALLALVGFSALCFADPVLMARRYWTARALSPPEDLSVDQAPQGPPRCLDFLSIDLIPPTFAGKTGPILDKPPLPPLSLTPLIYQNWGCGWRIDAFPGIPSDSLSTIAANTD
jgi:hypothetical protein